MLLRSSLYFSIFKVVRLVFWFASSLKLFTVAGVFHPYRCLPRWLPVCSTPPNPLSGSKSHASGAGVPNEGAEFGRHQDEARGGDCYSPGYMGVTESEVLELTQQWTELRKKERFQLVSLERALHHVRKNTLYE